MGTSSANRDHLFFPAIAILISVIAFAGFSFTYFGPLIGGSYPTTGFALHLHGWSFFLWYLSFPLQAVLVARGKYALHMALGRSSVVLVIVMVLTGILVLSVRVEEAVRQGAPAVWLLYGPLVLSNLVLFAAFYAAGVRMALRNRMQAHKRLMVVASTIALGAGFFRLVLFLSGFHPLSLPIGVFACGIFLVIGIAYDWISRRAVHPVYWIGLGVMLAVEALVLPQVNAGVVEWINQGLAALGEQLLVLYEPAPTVEF